MLKLGSEDLANHKAALRVRQSIYIYFLSETIQAQENGRRGTHFAKFLISNFLKGLTYSAMASKNIDPVKNSYTSNWEFFLSFSFDFATYRFPTGLITAIRGF